MWYREKKRKRERIRYLLVSDSYRLYRGRKKGSGRRGLSTKSGEKEGEHVKACMVTKDHEEFLEISLYREENEERRRKREREKRGMSKKKIEVMRLILCFLCFQRAAVSARLSGPSFFLSRFVPFTLESSSAPALVSGPLWSRIFPAA